jgi:hypothetical protein
MGRNVVRWRGLTADYDAVERQIMASLPVREQVVVHMLKGLLDGEVSGVENRAISVAESETRSVTQSRDAGPEKVPTSFTDPEDLEFGKPKRKRPIYALSWTWRQSKVYKTKAKATRGARAWKLWHERWGWKVVSIPGTVGYFAAKDNDRRAIVLHEYDKDSNQRLM